MSCPSIHTSYASCHPVGGLDWSDARVEVTSVDELVPGNAELDPEDSACLGAPVEFLGTPRILQTFPAVRTSPMQRDSGRPNQSAFMQQLASPRPSVRVAARLTSDTRVPAHTSSSQVACVGTHLNTTRTDADFRNSTVRHRSTTSTTRRIAAARPSATRRLLPMTHAPSPRRLHSLSH